LRKQRLTRISLGAVGRPEPRVPGKNISGVGVSADPRIRSLLAVEKSRHYCRDTAVSTYAQPRRPPLLARDSSSVSKLLGRLRFKQLALLVALDEHRNLHRAANDVHLAQPSASKLVHDLESLFDAPLFERLPTGMQPTELGAVALAFACRALGDLKRVAADVDHRRASREAHLIIGTATDVLPDVVENATAAIKRRRPTLFVQFLSAASDEIINPLIEGRLDVVLGYLHGYSRHANVDYEVIGSEALCMVARLDHPLCRELPLSLCALNSASWILHPHTNSRPHVLAWSFLCAGLKPPANVVESSSLTMTLNMVLKNDAITILPECAVRAYLQSGQLIRLPVAVDLNSMEFGMLIRSGQPLCPTTAEFRELLRENGGHQVAAGRRAVRNLAG
jgi:DNA-binding transcriptional LysR family regulator